MTGTEGEVCPLVGCLPFGDMQPACASFTTRGVSPDFAICAQFFNFSKSGEDRDWGDNMVGN
jgi:hypothetical protein